MKKRFVLLVLICGLIAHAGGALARSADILTAVIDGKTSDRVHLRESPSTESKSLGLYFTGTQVQYEAADSGKEWIWVNIGAEAGYMKSEFLYRGDNPGSVKPRQPEGVAQPSSAGGWVNMRVDPRIDAPVRDIFHNGDTVAVLGQTATAWYYVKAGDAYGYIIADFLQVDALGGTAGGAQGGSPGQSASITTVKADPKSSLMAYVMIENCAVSIVPTDEKIVCCTYDKGALSFEPSIARGTHILSLKSRGGKRLGHEAAAILAIPRDIYQSLAISIHNGDTDIASGIHCLYDIDAFESGVTLYYAADTQYAYWLGLTDSTCTFSIDERAADYTIRIEGINNSRISMPAGMPAYQASGPDGTYLFTAGSGSAQIQVDALKNSSLTFRFLP